MQIFKFGMLVYGRLKVFVEKICSRSFSVVRKSMAVNPIVAVAQMNCAHDLEENYKISENLIRKSKATVPTLKMIFFPECFDYIARSSDESIANALEESGPYINRFRLLAKELNVWISLGGFHEKSETNGKSYNSHLILDSNGSTVSKYRKLHLFDLDIKDKIRVKETDFTIRGTEILPPIATPVGNLGISTCYDLRFPQLSAILRDQGAQILTYPSAFTLITGMAHWEVLLRSQAIVNQCYVIAAAQTGKHNEKRMSYGHAMVADPWGTVVAQCSEGNAVCFAEIDLDYLKTVREQLPCYEHRRSDIYALAPTSEKTYSYGPDSLKSYQFGHHVIPSPQVFFRTALSFAFVNRKPVVPGHVLIASIRQADKLTDLTEAEVADLFKCVQRVQKSLENYFKVKSSTVAVQDGPEAGQTVKHVHVHILPRRGEEFENNDDVYLALAHHDKTESGLRTLETMKDEASIFRKLFD